MPTPGYSKFFTPTALLQTLIVGFARYLITRLFEFLGFSCLIRTDNLNVSHNTSRTTLHPPSATKLIQETLPVVKYKELDVAGYSTENCAVCLNEFEAEAEIRWLKNCRHIFHRSCLDGWINCDRDTCPLCRRSLCY